VTEFIVVKTITIYIGYTFPHTICPLSTIKDIDGLPVPYTVIFVFTINTVIMA